MGDMADMCREHEEQQYMAYTDAMRENIKLTDFELVECMRDDDDFTNSEICNGIVAYHDKNGRISEKQRNVLLHYLCILDTTFS